MPIVKSTVIHDDGDLANVLNYSFNDDKTNIEKHQDKVKNTALSTVFDYSRNLEKTTLNVDGEKIILVSGYECSPDTALFEFSIPRDKYMETTGNSFNRGQKIDPKEMKDIKKRAAKLGISEYELAKKENKLVARESIAGYHIFQSFAADKDLDPRLVHHIGIEFCEKLHDYQATISTHMDTDHLHNDIVLNAYNLNGTAKFNDCMKTRNYLRSISDELALKYGIPIILETARDFNKNMSWYEWKQKQEGNSWKQKMRNDIQEMARITSNWDEFKKGMISAGYSIRETKNTVTYTMPGGEEYKARDKTLGREFTRSVLEEKWGKKKTKEQEPVQKKELHKVIDPAELGMPHNKKFSLYISRYTLNGRRRSDLELILLAAIKIIQYIKDKYQEKNENRIIRNNPIYQTSAAKLNIMEESLHAVMDRGFETKKELEEALKKTGAELSHLRREQNDREPIRKFTSELSDMVETYNILKPIMERRGIDEKGLFLNDYTQKDIGKNMAEAMPMTAKQRRDLFVKLDDSTWKIDCKYEDLSYLDAKHIIDFLDGKNPARPEHVITQEQFDENRQTARYNAIREKRNKNFKLKMEGREASPAQIKKVKELIEKHPEYVLKKTENLTMYDASRVINYFKDNPFHSPLIAADMQEALKKTLENQQLVTNRKIETITVSEYEAVMAYIRSGRKTNMPNVLKPAQQITASQEKQLSELLEMKKETIPFPVSELSQVDGEMLYDYLLNKDVMPDVLKKPIQQAQTKDALFESMCLNYSVQEQEDIFRYRNVLEKFHSLGISTDEMENIQNQLESYEAECDTLDTNVRNTEIEYRNLKKLDYNINLAENKFFTYGPLWEEEKEPEIEIKESNDQKQEKEDDRIAEENRQTAEQNKEKMFSMFDKIYESILDR